MHLLDLPTPATMAAAIAAIAASQRVTLAMPAVIGHTRAVGAQPVEVAQ